MANPNQSSISAITHEIKCLLKYISCVTEQTQRDDTHQERIDYCENPLNPNLLSYCFDCILGFDVQYRIFEKVNYLHSKEVFCRFWETLDDKFTLPMMFIRSGLPISVDTSRYTKDINTVQQAEWRIEKMLFDIDNQINMDW